MEEERDSFSLNRVTDEQLHINGVDYDEINQSVKLDLYSRPQQEGRRGRSSSRHAWKSETKIKANGKEIRFDIKKKM